MARELFSRPNYLLIQLYDLLLDVDQLLSKTSVHFFLYRKPQECRILILNKRRESNSKSERLNILHA